MREVRGRRRLRKLIHRMEERGVKVKRKKRGFQTELEKVKIFG